MQLTQETVALYQQEAPELMDAVTFGEAEFIMRRDETTDYCVKFNNGLCSVHGKYGEKFLGDACHFFPRATRALGAKAVMTIAPSCPEAARLMLRMDAPFDRVQRPDPRAPFSMKQYLHDGMDDDAMLALHDAFIHAIDGYEVAAQGVITIAHVAGRLAMQPEASWAEAAGFYFKQAESAQAAADPSLADAVHIINALQGLMKAAGANTRPRLMAVLEAMADAIGASLDWERVRVIPSDDSAQRIEMMHEAWRGYYAQALSPTLKRYMQMQLSLNFFPFSGLGVRIDERALILAVRFATVQQALMSACMLQEDVPSEEDQVRIIQSLSRFMDHLATPEMSLAIYRELGWYREGRLRSLLCT